MGVSILSRPHTDPHLIRVGSAQVLCFPKENAIPERSQRGLEGGGQMTVFWVHKDLSYSYGEGIGKKLKCMAQPHKMKVLKKVDRILC